MSSCRQRHSLQSLSLPNTSQKTRWENRDAASAFISRLFYFFFFFLIKRGNSVSSAQHSEATIETINKKRWERREKRLLTPKASYFPWAVFQLQMEAFSDYVAQLFSKRTSSEIYCGGTCFLLICVAHYQRMCACVLSAFTCSLLWQCYIRRHVKLVLKWGYRLHSQVAFLTWWLILILGRLRHDFVSYNLHFFLNSFMPLL